MKPNKGVTIHNPHPIEIVIGETTTQDILLDLGSPLRKFVKEDDRMERIWGGQASGGNKGSMSSSPISREEADRSSILELLPTWIRYSHWLRQPGLQDYPSLQHSTPKSSPILRYRLTSSLEHQLFKLTQDVLGRYLLLRGR